VRVADLNWMQLEEYLSHDDRIVREALLNP
jgi:hypothetical protein